MDTRTCAADDCKTRFQPFSIEQIYCSRRCKVRVNVRAYRDRLKHGGGGDGGGGGRKQRSLFPKPHLAKASKPVQVPEPTLFESDIQATLGGAVEHMQDGSLRPIRTGIMSTGRRRPVSVRPRALGVAA